MKSTYFLGLLVAGAVAAATGCGDDDGSGTGGAGGSGPGGGTPTSTTTSPMTTTTTTMGDPNINCMTAEEMAVDAMDGTFGQLDPVDTDEDFFTFEGTAGQAIYILTDAKPSSNEFSPEYPDLVITLFKPDGTQYAQDDDPYPRDSNDSTLLTILPETGKYCLRVTECAFLFGDACSPSDQITNFDYGLAVVSLDPTDNGVVQETEPNNDETTPNLVEYELTPDGMNYYITQVYGDFSDIADVDVYSFTMPDTPPVDNEMTANFRSPYPPGAGSDNPPNIDGFGSDITVGNMTIFDTMDLTTPIARVNVSTGAELSVPMPLMPGVEYLLFVEHPGGTAGPLDFYFIDHFRAGSNPLEAADITNDLPTTPELLAAVPNAAMGESYFVDGKMALPTDVDHFVVPVPAAADDTWSVSVACGAQRSGSGLRQLKADLLNGDGSVINAMFTSTESETQDLLIQDAAVPVNPVNGELIVKLSQGLPDPNVSSRFYRCGIHYFPPQPM